MPGKLKISTILSFLVCCLLIYHAILGSSGLLERRHLEFRIKHLQEEIERLEAENQNLKNHQNILGISNIDYPFVPEVVRIIKFKEFVEVEGEDQILTTHVPLSIFRNKQMRHQSLILQFIKFFYLTAVLTLGLVFIIRFKKKN
jgi:hypothetical protein